MNKDFEKVFGNVVGHVRALGPSTEVLSALGSWALTVLSRKRRLSDLREEGTYK